MYYIFIAATMWNIR